ncbi:Gmad2 immunoglobulin-like domain-containing protein [Patescibacteria group bacterium]|nr:Gmad2 immunoglobulin-like domain-containing protein [Patescibacteria group bacterium]
MHIDIKIIILTIVIIFTLLIGTVVFILNGFDTSIPESDISVSIISSFDDCVAAGHPVLEIYPRQCSDGSQTFTEDIGNELAKIDEIRSSNPRPGQTITSPLSIEGEARGTWFFEAVFTATLIDGEGQQIATIPISTSDDWTTENFIPYSGEITFEKPKTAKGTLILAKDNPSGLPENSDELVIPILF